MSRFITATISQIGKSITGKTPSSEMPEDFGGDTPFVTPSDSFAQKYISETDRYLSKTGVANLRGKLLPPESIMVTCIGSAMGKVAMNREPCITNQQINSIIVADQYSPSYIYYLFLNNYKKFRNAATGSTAVPLLNKTDFDNLTFQIHTSKIEQEKISTILSCIDAKIDCNNRINAELESIAKILYDYWFIQFDFPDANGFAYKFSGGAMKFNEVLKRHIPAGWDDSTIGAIEPNIVTGKTPPKNHPDFFNGDIPFITIGDIRGNAFIVATEESLSNLGAESQKNKFLPAGAICVSCIASPGLVGFVMRPSQTNQQINSIICANDANRYYLYFAIKSYFEGSKAKTGNTFANMNKGDFCSIKILSPTNECLESFHKIVSPIFNQIKIKLLENMELNKLRSWLLPMLMNGQITIS